MNTSQSKKSTYFDGPVSKGFVALYTGKAVVLIASGLIGIFLPVFLYELFDRRFVHVLMFFGISSLVYVPLIALGAQFLNKYGFRKALRTSVFVGALIYTIYFFLNEQNMFYLIPLSVIALVLYRMLYWLPYHVDFAKFTDPKNRGRQLSSIRATRLIATIILPVVSGFIISYFGFSVLFFIAIILYLISGIPYIMIPRTNEQFSWGYLETWKKFFSNLKHKVMIAYVADGAETTIGLFLWPIFIFELLDGNYLEVGVISSLIIGIAVVLQLVTGKLIDTHKKKDAMLKWGTVFYSVGWIAKIFVVTAFEIFIAGAYHNITKIFTRTPIDTLTYEMSADEGHYVDEFTVLKEMAVHTGRVLMVTLAVVLSFFVSINWIFLLAALSALLLNLFRARDVHIAPITLR
jgi:MFS family permease